MKSVVLLLLLAVAVTFVMPRPSGNELATLTSIKLKENITVKGDVARGKRHVTLCKTKAHSTSFSLQTRLGNVAFAHSSASTHRHHPHRLLPGLGC